jgi:hypothetical protein
MGWGKDIIKCLMICRIKMKCHSGCCGGCDSDCMKDNQGLSRETSTEKITPHGVSKKSSLI